MTFNNLVKGRAYRFKVIAGNFNQEGPESDSGLHYACEPPSGLFWPILTETTSTSMTLEWSEPTSNGGCPLLGYYLYRDDGVTGAPSIEINSDQDALVRNIPTLRTLIVELSESDLGTKFTFQIFVYNREGNVGSSHISYMFATEPNAPTLAPVIL
jgi:hypothetical protein